MDSYRGNWSDYPGSDHPSEGFDESTFDSIEDEVAMDLPPLAVGQDERRMQVRAYNHWASLLGDRILPDAADLVIEALPGFAANSVVLDFSRGIENPAITHLGADLAEECGASRAIRRLADVPSRSLLSRITDHYLQILANRAPIGFEAEFVNLKDRTILYRGILLPFSSDGETISHILGVINWKELVDQHTTDALLLEIDQALSAGPAAHALPPPAPARRVDGPVAQTGIAPESAEPRVPLAWPEPGFGGDAFPGEPLASVPDHEGSEAMALADWLASARELAEVARGSEDRTRHSLYAAIGRAWDFALAAETAPDEFTELVADAGLAVQERAPMIPVVKLVFGAGYDKTRLTEYATALGRARRLGLPRGGLARHLAEAPGGLKGVIAEERQLRRDAGKPAATRVVPRESLARKLRRIAPVSLESLAGDGPEFALAVLRRLPDGQVVVLGEITGDGALLEKAAKRLV